MFGVRPYTAVNEKQQAAMERAGADYVFMMISQTVCNCVKGSLKG